MNTVVRWAMAGETSPQRDLHGVIRSMEQESLCSTNPLIEHEMRGCCAEVALVAGGEK